MRPITCFIHDVANVVYNVDGLLLNLDTYENAWHVFCLRRDGTRDGTHNSVCVAKRTLPSVFGDVDGKERYVSSKSD